MSTKNKIIIAVAAVLVIIVAGFLFLRSPQPTGAPATGNLPTQNASSEGGNQTATPNNSQTSQPPPVPGSSATMVTYTGNGFSPSTAIIKAGDSVTWVNNSSEDMWVASNVHPTHTLYSGTTMREHCPDATNSAFDECASIAPGGSWTFTFKKKGTWQYHNHLDASQTGEVVVQ